MPGIDIGLLHGFGASAFTWRHLRDPLSEGHRVTVLDRPWASRADQVGATVGQLRHQGLGPALLIGHSAGAEVAVATALQAPELVSGLVLIAPVLGRRPPRLATAAARLPGTMLVGPALLRAGSRFMGPLLRSVWVDGSKVTAEVVEGYRRPLCQPGVAESLWEMTRLADGDEPLEVGPTLDGLPCLTIVGDHDRWATPTPFAGPPVVIADCGHVPHEEQPEAVLGEIEEFLREGSFASMDP